MDFFFPPQLGEGLAQGADQAKGHCAVPAGHNVFVDEAPATPGQTGELPQQDGLTHSPQPGEDLAPPTGRLMSTRWRGHVHVGELGPIDPPPS